MKENPWLIVLVIFMLVSIFWSDIPYISFKRWVREFQAILMAFVFVSEPSPRQAMESILRRTTYILIPFSLLLIKYYPKYGVLYTRWEGRRMWLGVTMHKNGLGRLCLIVAFFLIWSLVRRWQGRNPPIFKYQTHLEIFILLLALFLMKGSEGGYSATAITALALGLLVYFSFSLAKKFKKSLGNSTVMIIVATIILIGLVSVFNKGSIVASFAPAVGRDPTLTTRTGVWESLLSIVMQRPFLGRGFGGFWTPRTRESFDISDAHSGYLDELLDLGFVGIMLTSAFLLSSARRAQKELSHDFDWGILWICYLIMAVLHNITESSITTLASQLTALVLFFSVSTVRFFRSAPDGPLRNELKV